MKEIMNLIHDINDEIKDAKKYAEKSMMYKAKSGSSKYDEYCKHYLEMSRDELKHATYMHDEVVATIDELKKVYIPPTEMMDEWNESHNKFVERVAWIKQMQSLI